MRSSLPFAVVSSLLLSLTGVAGAAQGGPAIQVQQLTPAPEGCPVSLDVRRSDLAQRLIPTANGRMAGERGQELEFTVQNTSLKNVAAMDGTLQMQSGKPKALLLEPGESSQAVAGERISLHLVHAIEGGKDGLLVQTVANRNPVEYLQLDRVLFADGSQWTRAQAASPGVCRFTPNPLVPVASR